MNISWYFEVQPKERKKEKKQTIHKPTISTFITAIMSNNWQTQEHKANLGEEKKRKKEHTKLWANHQKCCLTERLLWASVCQALSNSHQCPQARLRQCRWMNSCTWRTSRSHSPPLPNPQALARSSRASKGTPSTLCTPSSISPLLFAVDIKSVSSKSSTDLLT